MRKVLVRVLPALLLLGILLHVSFRAVQAQEEYTPQDAINFAAAHPAFASGLEARPGWTATAYTGNATFGIWHVEFWDAEGEALGWADLSLEHNLVYSWAADYGTTEQQNADAEDAICTFLSSNAEVMDLVGSLDDVNLYVEYAYWDQRWAAYIDLGPNSLYVTMRSASNPPMGLEDLELGYIYFPNILSYEEWSSAQEAQAISIAFQNSDISAVLRDHAGWTAAGELGDDGVWSLTFAVGERQLLTARVVTETQALLEYTISDS